MNSTFLVALDRIDTDGRIREADPEQVEALRGSIAAVGLINPVTVCQVGERYRLVAGGNRLEACRAAGFTEILCNVRELNEHERVIAECDENLCGPKLSVAEKSLFAARRKDAYEALHPETKIGRNQHSERDGQVVQPSFAEDQASKTGVDERTVRRDAERGAKVIPEVLSMIKGTKLDTGVYLDKLKKLPPNEQVTAAKRDLAASKRADEAEKKASRPSPQNDDLPEPDFDPLAVRTFTPAVRDYGGLTADQRVDELEAHVTALEGDIQGYVAELKTFRDMKVQFEQGGFDKVVAGKDEVIRGLETRVYSESAGKAEWMRKAKFWEKQARELGWRDTRKDAPADVPADYDEAFLAAVNGAEGGGH